MGRSDHRKPKYYETAFPIPLGLSCTWDLEIIEKSARIAAIEASADGINWTFSPMVDIARDARWGRIAESSGEDPYLGSRIAEAMVKGYQGTLTKNNEIMACVKHFALYGAVEGGLDYNIVDMSPNRMYNEYFPPYKAAVDAGVGSVMTAYNEVNGIPATGSKWLFTDVLRKQWGFTGFVVSDYTAVSEMVDHGVGDISAVSALALKAGVNMDMVSEGYLTTLMKSLNEKKISMADIDNACRRILEAKYKLGLFDNPYKFLDPKRRKLEIYTHDNRKFARETASKSFVLLRNEGSILPLKIAGKIALVGPLANAANNMAGTWSINTDQNKSITVLQGLKDAVGNKAEIMYAKGANLTENPTLEINSTVTMFGKTLNRDERTEEEIREEALKIANQSDVIVAALGESAEMSGESSSRADISIPDVQQRLLKELVKTGKPVVLVLFTGRPLVLTWENKNVPAILNVWFGGSEAGYAISDVLFGKVNPSGKLTTSFPQHLGQLPLYYARKNTGRPIEENQWFSKVRTNYLDVSNSPVYPFGFGLSYTTYQYNYVNLSDTTLNGHQKLYVDLSVTNSGNTDGTEVVQLYIRDVVGSVTRPIKELKGFQKVFLKSGETKKITFVISTDDLKFYNNDLQYDWEPGEFEVMIGPNSRDVMKRKVTWVK